MKLKKINLRGVSEILSEKELKNVLGGTVYSDKIACYVIENNVQVDSYWCDDDKATCESDCKKANPSPKKCNCGYVPIG